MYKQLFVVLCIVLLEGALAAENMKYVDIGEHPYHVSIQVNGEHACSGALIHESWVITAALGISQSKPENVVVRARTSTLLTGSTFEVANIIVHPEYDTFMPVDNIALVQLKVPVEFGEKLQPVGLPDNENYELDDGTMCFVTGWRHAVNSSVESELTATEVPLVNRNQCSFLMPCYRLQFQKMICAGNMIKGVEACQGDRGAPLVKDHTLIGLLSYGLGCKTMIHPGIYTRVSSYLPWISENTGIRHI